MTEWVKYTGSPEQIEEIITTRKDILFRLEETYVLKSKILFTDLKDFLITANVREYLICAQHPYAKEISQWGHTGQPVYWRRGECGTRGVCQEYFPPFAHPNEFEYSFTPFED